MGPEAGLESLTAPEERAWRCTPFANPTLSTVPSEARPAQAERALHSAANIAMRQPLILPVSRGGTVSVSAERRSKALPRPCAFRFPGRPGVRG